MAKSSVKHRAISVRQGNNLAILAHKTGINRPASTYACVWKKIQGEADRHETDPPPAAQHLPCAEPPHAAAHPCAGRAGGGLCFGGLLARLFTLQILDPSGYANRAAAQQLRDTTLPAARGEIYSADGVTLAAAKPAGPSGPPRGNWRMSWCSPPPKR